MRNKRKLLCLLCLPSLALCEAGSVRLFNGERYEGKVSLSGSGIVLAPDQGPVPKIDFPNVFEATFQDTDVSNFQPGVFLVSGSFISGTVRSLDEPVLKLKVGGQEFSVNSSAIAAVVFEKTPRDQMLQIPGGSTGAVLPNGDFFAGKVTEFKADKLAVNSVVLGPQHFKLGGKTGVAAVVLRDRQSAAARYEVSTKDGCWFAANDLKIDQRGIALNDAVLGTVKIGADEIAQIHVSAGRYQLLSKQKPVSGELVVSPEEDGTILTKVNVPVSYAVPPGLTFFACSVALSKDAPPQARVAFAVYGDGRFLYRGAVLNSTSAPQNLLINAGAVRTITLRVEPGSPGVGAGAVSGRWIEPMLLRP